MRPSHLPSSIADSLEYIVIWMLLSKKLDSSACFQAAQTRNVNASLITARLNERPSYRALSYAWGDIDDTREILLHGQPFKITASLEKALKQLRRFDRPIILWADAISI